MKLGSYASKTKQKTTTNIQTKQTNKQTKQNNKNNKNGLGQFSQYHPFSR